MILLNTTTDTGAGTYVSTGVQVRVPPTRMAEFELNVTSAATAVGDTFDCYVQTSADAGGTWDDLVHFTQVLGNGGAKKFLARWTAVIAPTTALAAPQDAALAAGVVQGPKALFWRVKRVVVSSSAPVFTFIVYAHGVTKLGPNPGVGAYVAPQAGGTR
jgi:hypothetical protein